MAELYYYRVSLYIEINRTIQIYYDVDVIYFPEDYPLYYLGQ